MRTLWSALSLAALLLIAQVRASSRSLAQAPSSSEASSPSSGGGDCGRNYDPVCGADGQTYGNECVAKSANVIIASQGKCASCTGSKGDCICNSQPQDPVCAAGLTWMNQCEAECNAKSCITDGVCQYNPDGGFSTSPGGAPNGGVSAASSNTEFPAATRADYDYGEALSKSLLFYRIQQSGSPSIHRLAWRGDSCQDCKGPGGEDVSGGYYEAGGSFLKLGLPSAYLVTNLAWGLDIFKAGYERTQTSAEAQDLLAWGADYLVSAWNPDSKSFVAVVGDNTTDFNYYGPIEEYQYYNKRPSWYADSDAPASEVAGEAAAALAAAYIALNRSSQAYLSAAESLYAWGASTAQSYSQSGGRGSTIQNWLYPSTGFQDELAWAAAWLYGATNKSTYLDDANKYYNQCCNKGGYTFEVGEKTPGLHVLLAQLDPSNSDYRTNAKAFFDQYLNQDIPHTERGAAYPYHWGALRPAMSTSFLALIHSSVIRSQEETYAARLFNYAQYQANYVLGATGFSWLVGFGEDYPDYLWHKPSYNSYIDWPLRGENVWLGNDRGPWTVDGPEGNIIVQASKLDMEGSFSPQRFVAYGALVPAPLHNDGRVTGRKDYTYTEPTLEGQGGPTGTFAGLAAFYTDSSPFSACGLDLGWGNANATITSKSVDNREGCSGGSAQAG